MKRMPLPSGDSLFFSCFFLCFVLFVFSIFLADFDETHILLFRPLPIVTENEIYSTIQNSRESSAEDNFPNENYQKIIAIPESNHHSSL